MKSSKKFIHNNNRINYKYFVGITFFLILISILYTKKPAFLYWLQNVTESESDELIYEEMPSINLISTGLSGGVKASSTLVNKPTEEAIYAYNNSKSSKDNDEVATAKAKANVKEALLDLEKGNNQEKEALNQIKSSNTAENPSIKNNDDLAAHITTKAVELLRGTVEYVEPDNSKNNNKLVARIYPYYDPKIALKSNFKVTTDSEAYCNLENGYAAVTGSVIVDNNKCSQCLVKRESNSTQTYLKKIRCSNIPTNRVVGIQSTSSGQNSSKDCILYHTNNQSYYSTTPNNNTDIKVLIPSSNKDKSKSAKIYAFNPKSGATTQYKQCIDGKWTSPTLTTNDR